MAQMNTHNIIEQLNKSAIAKGISAFDAYANYNNTLYKRAQALQQESLSIYQLIDEIVKKNNLTHSLASFYQFDGNEFTSILNNHELIQLETNIKLIQGFLDKVTELAKDCLEFIFSLRFALTNMEFKIAIETSAHDFAVFDLNKRADIDFFISQHLEVSYKDLITIVNNNQKDKGLLGSFLNNIFLQTNKFNFKNNHDFDIILQHRDIIKAKLERYAKYEMPTASRLLEMAARMSNSKAQLHSAYYWHSFFATFYTKDKKLNSNARDNIQMQKQGDAVLRQQINGQISYINYELKAHGGQISTAMLMNRIESLQKAFGSRGAKEFINIFTFDDTNSKIALSNIEKYAKNLAIKNIEANIKKLLNVP